ncbi:MAG: hypothetical protein CMD53_04115 [Gammaproteobacteria bacterium]|nr:hypothetical protein [Gammaproteobacteria bacterium]
MSQEIKIHEKNNNFNWSVPSGPYEFLNDDQVKFFDKYGYVLIEDAFNSEEIFKVLEKIDPYEHNVTEALRGLDGGKFFISRAEEITFTTHLVTQSEELKEFSKHNVFAGICKDLIGNNVRLYWDQAVYKKPGTKDEFPWHQDNGYTFIEPQAYLTCWVALTDADESNGCPCVIPGLHKKGTLHHKTTDLGYEIPLDPSTSISLPVKAGSIAVFSSLTPHRTGPNLSNNIRKAYILQYAPEGSRRLISHSLTEEVNEESRQYFILKDGSKV